MRIATVKTGSAATACLSTEEGFIPLERINNEFKTSWPTDLWTLLQDGALDRLRAWHDESGRREVTARAARLRLPEPIQSTAPYRCPRKIWGIGLNYREHAADLSEKAPETEPASFMKPDTTIVGPGDTVIVPRQSERTTAEAELGVVIGKTCRDIRREDWLSCVAGYVSVLDMTAEDILRRNPRYLTRAKSFDTFFSFGPVLVTPDEVPDVLALEVSTVINGRIHARNTVRNMTFPPDFLVAFHSQVMTLLPGDIISTGTPGAAWIQEGDRIECRIEGFPALVNSVRDLKTEEGK